MIQKGGSYFSQLDRPDQLDGLLLGRITEQYHNANGDKFPSDGDI
jgi:hypothetical protein